MALRTPSVKTIQFVIGDPGQISDPATVRYLRDLELRIQSVLRLIMDGHMEITYAAPLKPRAGDFRYADGTMWNPGSGEGFYYYNQAGVWKFLG